ncbi:hypothetical protein FDF08_03995 [Micrococcus luteus]|nr:hypothetical protein FDF08_03995 [Micrococcus luteus]
MAPEPPQADPERIRRARHELAARGLIAGSVPPALVGEQIEQSWRRSVAHEVSLDAVPQGGADLDPALPLRRAAETVVRRWAEGLGQLRVSLVVADATGRILVRRALDTRDEDALDAARAAVGYGFGEQDLGTNGLGTPLQVKGDVYISGAEHFTDGLAGLTCAGTPVLDPVTGRAVGALAVASRADEAHPLMLGVARQAAAEVMEALRDETAGPDLEIARAFRGLRGPDRAVLVMSADTVMTDLPGLARIDAQTQAVLWETLRRRSPGEEPVRLSLPGLEGEALARRLPGAEAAYALEFDAVPAPEPALGRAAAAPRSGPPAGGGPERGAGTAPSVGVHPSEMAVAYDGIGDALTAAAEQTGLVELTGPRGSGKRFQAVRWLRDRALAAGTADAPDPLHVELADVTGPQGEDLLRRVAARGRAVVVAGTLPTAAETAQARAGLRTTVARVVLEHPEAPRVVLLRSVDASAEDDVAGQVRLPALAEVPQDIPALLARLSERLHPGAPPPRFSPEALQRILAWPWPDNMAGLSRLVSLLPGLRRGATVQVEDLPAALRAGPGSRLTRMEQAERDAIVAALREHGGNRSAAAAALGIGRATLYRRLKALRITV